MKQKISCVVFDLDGTLIKSHKTIYLAACKAIEMLGYSVSLDEKKFSGQIGKHFSDIFSGLDFHINDMSSFIQIYKKHYFDFIQYSELYPGVNDILKYIKAKDLKVALLTTKGQNQAEEIIQHFNLQAYFDIIVGRRDGLNYKPSADPLILIKDELRVKMAEILMIGDTEMDIQCGKNAGSLTCAVSFGYRKKMQLEAELPEFIIDELSQLQNII
jgi:phosphoglycolate phosphatase